MIDGFRLTNFKSWRDTGPLGFGRLTGFFGTNSSGKSAILQALLLMKQTAESPDPNIILRTGGPGSLVNVGTFQDFIHWHEKNRKLGVTLRWGAPDWVEFLVSIGQDRGWLVVEEVSYKDSSGGEFIGGGESNAGSKFYAFDTRSPLDRDLDYAFEEILGRVEWLGPLRADPLALYQWSGSLPSNVGSRGESTIEALLASRSAGVEEKVAFWLRRLGLSDAFGLREIAKDRNLYEAILQINPLAGEVRLKDVGVGVSQLLPVITLCYFVPPGSIILLEQPEIHLHPSAQGGLADLFLDAIAERNIQIILESHSEHLLHRFQLRIAEGRIPASDAALYFCRTEGAESKAERLEIDDNGYIANWPPDFFGNDMADLVAQAEVAAGRERVGKR